MSYVKFSVLPLPADFAPQSTPVSDFPYPIDYQPMLERWVGGPLERWADQLPAQLEEHFSTRRHGDLAGWLETLTTLPALRASRVDLDRAEITVGSAEDADESQRDTLRDKLMALHPWRKGPYRLFDIHIDTEWRSDWKWQRLVGALEPLTGRRVLDVGCGSGYHAWRMLGAGAREVIGIDPTPLFVCQFWAVQRYVQRPGITVLPLGIQHLPAELRAFDTVFSMGVLYHRRSPMDHLLELRDSLVSGGQLVLETLVIEGTAGQCLVPSGRYARMGNVWFIPSCDELLIWLGKVGFRTPRVVDVSVTTTDEQRATDWMRFHSLADFLDPADASRTREGYPAPRRAVLTAFAP